MVDYAFLTFITIILVGIGTFLFRKRLITALTRSFLADAALTFDQLAFEEVSNEEGVKVKVLTPYAKGFLGQAAPVLVSEGMKAIKLKVPANLPVNAAGELDFMAPVLQKLAAGKKVKIEDFLPVIMEKAMPYVEGFLGKIGQPSSPETETKNPFL